MTSLARLLVRLDVVDANEVSQQHAESFTDSIAVLATNGKREPIVLANGNTALVVPAGANGVLLLPLTGAFTTTLKGANADTGIVLATTALTKCPILLPLGTAPTIVLTCTGAATLEAVWF